MPLYISIAADERLKEAIARERISPREAPFVCERRNNIWHSWLSVYVRLPSKINCFSWKIENIGSG